MNCSSTEELFEGFLDGRLTAGERRGVLAHVDRCAMCRGLLEELRAVDALLLTPRRVELAPNFTFATMAEARSLPPPVRRRAPVRAYLVTYLAATWLGAIAALVLEPQTMRALAGTLGDVARSAANAVGGVSAVIALDLAHGGSTLAAVLGALVALDVTVIVGFGAALRFGRPRVLDRIRP